MTTATLTLTEFLLARIAEDEEAPALPGYCGQWKCMPSDAEFEHARARRRAECEAKRRIVELHSQAAFIHVCQICGTSDTGADHWPCRTLLALATPYADHLAYRAEWRP